MTNYNPRVSLFIQGNIGSGKSTILNILRKVKDYEIIDEPVNAWNKLGILDEFYKDKKKRGYTFQTFAFISRLEDYVKSSVNGKNVKIYERSIYADKYCFAQNSHDCGYIDDFEWKVYNEIFDKWVSLVNALKKERSEIEITVFVKCSPEKCMERIKKRNRDAESQISMDYLTKLHNIHTKWIEELRQKEKIVYIIDSDKDWNNSNEQEYEEYIRTIFSDIINHEMSNLTKKRSIH